MQADVSIVLKGEGHPRFMLVSDLDHTMVQNEDPTHERLQLFNRLWASHFAGDSLLVFSTGRSPALFAELWDEAPLLTPDILICSVGTELFYRPPGSTRLIPDGSWEAELDKGWDRDKVTEVAGQYPQLKPQPASEQRRHKVSFHLQRSGDPQKDAALLDALRAGLAEAGVAAKVVYSGGVDVDVLAQGAGKGRALEFLLGQLRRLGRWPADGVQVNGDSGNDAELFAVPGVRGCVVANAHPELLEFYHAHKGATSGSGGDGSAAAGAAAAPAPAGAGGGAAASGGGGRGAEGASIFLASQPCAGGIMEALGAFGSLSDAQSAAAAAGAAGAAAAAARAAAVALGPLQAGGGLAAVAEAGATCVTAEGRAGLITTPAAADPVNLAPGEAPVDDVTTGGITWVDGIEVREVAPSLQLVTYKVWRFSGARRDSHTARASSALLRVPAAAAVDGAAGAGAGGAAALVHLHEGELAYDVSMTKAFRDLAAQSAS